METSQNRTITPGLRRMGVFEMRESENRVCDTHGEYLATKYPSGWTPCPACMKAKIDAESAEHVRQIDAGRAKAKGGFTIEESRYPLALRMS